MGTKPQEDDHGFLGLQSYGIFSETFVSATPRAVIFAICCCIHDIYTKLVIFKNGQI